MVRKAFLKKGTLSFFKNSPFLVQKKFRNHLKLSHQRDYSPVHQVTAMIQSPKALGERPSQRLHPLRNRLRNHVTLSATQTQPFDF
jgi:hypothetical protein